uniref:Uncharacterized protein n=1 Tax=Arion vulgaris TaxID=1028688 RepID=A0A0B7AEQ6_9EUPU
MYNVKAYNVVSRTTCTVTMMENNSSFNNALNPGLHDNISIGYNSVNFQHSRSEEGHVIALCRNLCLDLYLGLDNCDV